MTSITHAAMGLGIGALFPKAPIGWAVAFSLLPDLDHLLFVRSLRLRVGGMRHARTFLHELLGGVLYLGLGGALELWRPPLGALLITCVSAHLLCDFLNGYSRPFVGIRSAPSVDLGVRLWVRVVQEVVVGGVFLWIFFTKFVLGGSN
ncbi:MAG: hypothetical protein KatS3mg115_0758 [Candidatus Poribacteria bacterium]|nr:MAG: hypothetical protein KatS3mg115_0758 [Candidatus Poribacteria bacterium]